MAVPTGTSSAQDAGLDPTFGGDGTVTTDFGGNDVGADVLLQADGRIVAAGSSDVGGTVDFALARYQADGSLDPSFGGDGMVITDLGGQDIVTDLAIGPDGQILAVGFSAVARTTDFALARYEPDGTLDPSFGGDGLVTTDLSGGADRAIAVAIQRDGRIIVVGGEGRSGSDFALARYEPDGSLDRAFGGDGVVTTHFGGRDEAADVEIGVDGRIIVVGSVRGPSRSHFALARYSGDGALDRSFGRDGKVRTDFGRRDVPLDLEGARTVVIRGGGALLVQGWKTEGFCPRPVFARYRADGRLDTSFRRDGKVIAQGIATAEMVPLSDGRMVVSGRTGCDVISPGSVNFAVDVYGRRGALQTSFHTDFGGCDWAEGVVRQRDGRVVAAGKTGTCADPDSDFALARYVVPAP